MENQNVTRQPAQSLPAATVEAARVKHCRIHLCAPMTSGLGEREMWMLQQGASMKFIASLHELVKHIENVAPMAPLVMKPVGFDAESAGHALATDVVNDLAKERK